MFMLREAGFERKSSAKSREMDLMLTGSSGMSGAVNNINGLVCFLELLTQYSILFSTALSNC